VVDLTSYEEDAFHDTSLEAREENTTDADAAPCSVVRSPTPTASTADTDEALKGVQNDNSDGRTPNREIGDGSNDGAEADLLYVSDEQGFHRVSGQVCRGVHR
jgi:hypothetical protein